MVYLKSIKYPTAIQLKDKTLQHLLIMYEMKQENINSFLGICINISDQDYLNTFVWKFCYRGSLADIIQNSSTKLDWPFKMSFLYDLVKVNIIEEYKLFREKRT